MLTVNDHGSAVESRLAGGGLRCPDCVGILRPWGWARRRLIRSGAGPGWLVVTHRPRRGRCRDCESTHVLLDGSLAARRADTAVVIAAAIEAKVAGLGHRPIAAWLGRPASTVRGWLRAFTASAAAITATFTGLLQRDGADPARIWPAPSSSAAAAAISMITAYGQVLASRLGVFTLTWDRAGLAAVGPWLFCQTRWVPGQLHELALMPGPALDKSGDSPDATGAGAAIS